MRLYDIILTTDSGSLIYDQVLARDPGVVKANFDWKQARDLAHLYGFGVEVILHDQTMQYADHYPDRGEIGYDRAHDQIWDRLRKRGEVLKLRRETKKREAEGAG